VNAVFHFGGDRIERVLARAGNRDDRALFMERFRDRGADAARGARDQRGFSRKIEHHFRPYVFAAV
jgi:hypothetical protein